MQYIPRPLGIFEFQWLLRVKLRSTKFGLNYIYIYILFYQALFIPSPFLPCMTPSDHIACLFIRRFPARFTSTCSTLRCYYHRHFCHPSPRPQFRSLKTDISTVWWSPAVPLVTSHSAPLAVHAFSFLDFFSSPPRVRNLNLRCLPEPADAKSQSLIILLCLI